VATVDVAYCALARNRHGDCIPQCPSQGQSGKHLLALSFSDCDPTATSGTSHVALAKLVSSPYQCARLKPLRCRLLSLGGRHEATRVHHASRRCDGRGRWPRVRNNRQDGLTGWVPRDPSREQMPLYLTRALEKACEASATALARMSPSSTASLTANWNGCPH